MISCEVLGLNKTCHTQKWAVYSLQVWFDKHFCLPIRGPYIASVVVSSWPSWRSLKWGYSRQEEWPIARMYLHIPKLGWAPFSRSLSLSSLSLSLSRSLARSVDLSIAISTGETDFIGSGASSAATLQMRGAISPWQCRRILEVDCMPKLHLCLLMATGWVLLDGKRRKL